MFVEFIKEEDIHNDEITVLDMNELEIGKNYELLITTYSGFFNIFFFLNFF